MIVIWKHQITFLLGATQWEFTVTPKQVKIFGGLKRQIIHPFLSVWFCSFFSRFCCFNKSIKFCKNGSNCWNLLHRHGRGLCGLLRCHGYNLFWSFIQSKFLKYDKAKPKSWLKNNSRNNEKNWNHLFFPYIK